MKPKKTTNKVLKDILSSIPKDQLQKIADLEVAMSVYEIYVKKELDIMQKQILSIADSANNVMEVVRIASMMRGVSNAMERLKKLPEVALEMLKVKLDNKSN